ncbi:hypothetical protein Fmac_013623 [Flemingia macrophylla]|uniref:Uncharacterized protein n=1 Tax=Flemingia macrophylla TaxID=520843 RepID=A0ABD1MTN0_9FABA
MGNCCKPASSMEWGGDDWSFLTSHNKSCGKVFDEAHALNLGKVRKEKLAGELKTSSSNINGKVTIKISKKDLTQLLENQQQLNKRQVGAVSAEQVLLRLIKARNHHAHQRLWRPMLESIPEVSFIFENIGNCCKPASSMEWDGEDWSFLLSNSKNTSSNKVFNEADHGHGLSLRKVQKEKLVAALRASCSVANGTFKARDHDPRDRLWRPLLESIPEVTDSEASSLEWAGEDWSFLVSDNKSSSRKVFDEARALNNIRKVQKKEKLAEVLRASSSDANGKVTIKILKKELAQLLENQQQLNIKKQIRTASAEQVLLRLIKARDHNARHRLWRPVLESIHEVS